MCPYYQNSFAPKANCVILALKSIPWDIDYVFKACAGVLALLTTIDTLGYFLNGVLDRTKEQRAPSPSTNPGMPLKTIERIERDAAEVAEQQAQQD